MENVTDLEIMLKNINNNSVEVGWFEKGIADIAEKLEYGFISHVTAEESYNLKNQYNINLPVGDYIVPPRPHMQKTVDEYSKTWAEDVIDMIKDNDNNLLETLGQLMQEDYRTVLYSGEFVENSPVTLAIRQAKGLPIDKPLVATHTLQNEVKYKISKGT